MGSAAPTLGLRDKVEDKHVDLAGFLLEDEENSNLIQCTGPCKLHFHNECANVTISDDSLFVCNTCRDSSWQCFICHDGTTDPSDPDTEIIKCDFSTCGRHYHRYQPILKYNP